MKLAIVGIQGLDPYLAFDEFSEELVNLTELADRGLHGSITSTDPPEPVPAWPTFVTGQNPGRTGVVGERGRDWQRTRQGRRAPYGEGGRASSRDLRAPLWNRAAKDGGRIALVGVPQAFPVEPVDGSLVAGPPAPSPEASFTHPPALADEIDDLVDEAFFAEPEEDASREQVLEQARRRLDQHFDVAEHLATERPWELFFCLAPGLDAVQQAAWSTHDDEHPLHDRDDEDAVRAHYRHVDERLGRLVDALPEDAAVLVVSEAGAQPGRGSLRLNGWLRREGYLVLDEEPGDPRALEPGIVDWSRTQAWATGGPAGRIHLNVAGREPEGIVDPLDYEDVRDELGTALATVETTDGQVGVDALKPREVHEGPRVDEGPDLLCYVEGLAVRCEAGLGHESLLDEPERGRDEGSPTREGAFVLRDPEDRYTGTVDDLAIVDGAPTVLDLLDVPVPEAMDGRVLQPDGSLGPS